MKLIGADFGRVSTAFRFISRSMSIAHMSAAAAGKPWKTKASRKVEPNGGFRSGGIDRRYYDLCVLLGLRNSLRGGDGLSWAEGACRTSQESLRAHEIADLRNRNTTQRKRRRVVSQGDPLQCAEDVACPRVPVPQP